MPHAALFLLLLLLALLCLPRPAAVNASPAAALADAQANANATATAAVDCALVRPVFQARNLSTTLTAIPLDGTSLTVCKAKYTCCSSEMESNLKTLVKKEYLSTLQRNSQSVQGILASTAIHFQDYVRQMMLKVESRTVRLFGQVFGVEAASTEAHVRHFFGELQRHLDDRSNAERWSGAAPTEKATAAVASPPPPPADDRLGRVTESFFARLFPFMYEATLGRRRRQLDADYRRCLETRMEAIFPAMEAVRGLRRDLSATLEATRALMAALEWAARALNASNVAALSERWLAQPRCNEALLRMAYCGLCAGQPPPAAARPCAGYCLNVMRGCVAQQAAQLDSHWSAFYEALRKLMAVVNRGQSLVPLEDLLKSLLSRIAEPMLALTERSEHVHLKAKFICGQTKWANESSSSLTSTTDDGDGGDNGDGGGGADELGVVRGVTVSKVPGGRADWSMQSIDDDDDFNFRSTLLSNKIRQFEQSVPPSSAFYAGLADAVCRGDDGLAETRPNVACWNGDRIAEYTKSVVSIQMPSQKYNPELPLTVQTSADPRIADLVDRLERMRRLVQSHIAMATATTATAESESPYQRVAAAYEQGSGSGDGGRMSPDGVSDDEDAISGWQEQGSGSGSGDLAAVTRMPAGSSDTDGSLVDVDVSSRTLFKQQQQQQQPQPQPPPPPPSSSSVDGGSRVRIGSAPPASGCASCSRNAVLLLASTLLYVAVAAC